MIRDYGLKVNGQQYHISDEAKLSIHSYLMDSLNIDSDNIDMFFKGIIDGSKASFLFQITEKNEKGFLVDPRLHPFTSTYVLNCEELLINNAKSNIDILINEDQELKLRKLGI